MDALDFRAFFDVFPHARREASREPERTTNVRRVEIEQLRNGGSGAEYTRRRRVFPATGVQWQDGPGSGDAAHDVVADHRREDHPLRRSTGRFGCREHRREDGAERMRGAVRVAVVEVEAVRIGAVHERRVRCGRASRRRRRRSPFGSRRLGAAPQQRSRYRQRGKLAILHVRWSCSARFNAWMTCGRSCWQPPTEATRSVKPGCRFGAGGCDVPHDCAHRISFVAR